MECARKDLGTLRTYDMNNGQINFLINRGYQRSSDIVRTYYWKPVSAIFQDGPKFVITVLDDLTCYNVELRDSVMICIGFYMLDWIDVVANLDKYEQALLHGGT
jgi:hypothetical protein